MVYTSKELDNIISGRIMQIQIYLNENGDKLNHYQKEKYRFGIKELNELRRITIHHPKQKN